MRSESGLIYLEASADGQVEKLMGDTAWLPFAIKQHETRLDEVIPALTGAQSVGQMELDFVELLPNTFVDIQYQCQGGRQFVWLRNTSRHAAHLRAAQQVANSKALHEAVAARWLDDVRRARSHLRVVLESIPLPIAYWSMTGDLLFANARFESLVGETGDPEKRVPHATDEALGAMRIPDEVWDQAQHLRGAATVSFVRRFLSPKAKSRLQVDLAPTGDIAGLLDITEFLPTH
jgi:PAS domain-containing protein